MPSNDEIDAMINELCELEEGLTEWEAEFIDSISRQWKRTATEGAAYMSPRQLETLEKIYRERIEK